MNPVHIARKLKKSLRQSRNSTPFMETKGSLSCSQNPGTGTYPEVN